MARSWLPLAALAAVGAAVAVSMSNKASASTTKPTKPPVGLPARYQYPPDKVIRTRVAPSDPHGTMDFVQSEALRHTGDATRGWELVAANPCIATLATLATEDRLILPKSWYAFVDQNLDISQGVPLPPYPPGAPFAPQNAAAIAIKSVCDHALTFTPATEFGAAHASPPPAPPSGFVPVTMISTPLGSDVPAMVPLFPPGG